MSHAELSGAVLARWNLPEPIQEAARFHHSPEEAAGGDLHLSHLVRAADQLANDLGIACCLGRPIRRSPASTWKRWGWAQRRLPCSSSSNSNSSS